MLRRGICAAGRRLREATREVSEEVAMVSSVNNPNKTLLRMRRRTSVRRRLWLVLLLGLALDPANLRAQQAVTTPTTDTQTIQMLLQRIDKLEARVSQLEAERQGTPRPEPVKQEVASITPVSI